MGNVWVTLLFAIMSFLLGYQFGEKRNEGPKMPLTWQFRNSITYDGKIFTKIYNHGSEIGCVVQKVIK